MLSLRSYRTFQALILAGLGIFLFSKIMDGRILFYINQRFVILVLLAALGLIMLAQLVLRERPDARLEQDQDSLHEDDRDHHAHADTETRQGWTLWLVALPLLIGLLVPERPLGASALQNRGVNTSASLQARGGADLALALPPQQRNVMDWIIVYQASPDPSVLEGQPVDVTGFVYHDIRLADDQFMVSRFTIACCVADALALGMVVEADPAADQPLELPDNTWVRVRGSLRSFSLDGKSLPMIVVKQIETVPVPEQPYLFP